jgi:hypothetical protein
MNPSMVLTPTWLAGGVFINPLSFEQVLFKISFSEKKVFVYFTYPQKNLKLHIVEASTTRGTTAVVYCLINSSLYTGTVHRWWSTPNWLDGHQGCSQLSTILYIILLQFSAIFSLKIR